MKREKLKKFFAIISLVILLIFIAILTFALITANGKLAMAMIFSLIFISIFLYIVMHLYGKFTNNSKSPQKM